MNRVLLLSLMLAPWASFAQVINKPKLALRNWATGLSEPVALANCGDDRMFVVQRAGSIKIISDSMTVVQRPFLNITSQVNSGQNEQGLLGLAFEPNYLESGYFYVYYITGTGAGTSRVSRFQVSNDPDSADAASETIIYEWPQPYWNHNGGDIHFGPDGYLYVGFGDGGSGNDPEQNGQDYTEPLGGMIRIDVSDHGTTYTIPESNPFFGTASDTLPEVWATGLRNPWRWSFDRSTGDLWIGDVGQNAWEEVDFWPAGDNSCPNFGWRCREGFVATPGVSQSNCGGAADYVAPVAAFDHVAANQGGQAWCSVIGGYVYRGNWFPHHTGHYIFTDYCAGDFLTFGEGNDVDTMLMSTTAGYSGFGQDAEGQLYVANQINGQVRKLYDPCPMADPEITAAGDLLTATEGNTYQWYLNGEAIPSAMQQTYLASVSGEYQVAVNFGSPCTLLSDTLVFIVSQVVERAVPEVKVYPQPARDVVTFERSDATEDGTLQVFDLAGKHMRSERLAAGQKRAQLATSQLAGGTYEVRMVGADGALQARATFVIVH